MLTSCARRRRARTGRLPQKGPSSPNLASRMTRGRWKPSPSGFLIASCSVTLIGGSHHPRKAFEHSPFASTSGKTKSPYTDCLGPSA